MNWAALADLALTQSVGAFGQAITYQLAPQAPVSASAVLGQTVQKEDASPGRYARIFVRLADFPNGFVRGAVVTFQGSGVEYSVFEVDVDGNGGAYATLRNNDA
jgi:hypothetical protein